MWHIFIITSFLIFFNSTSAIAEENSFGCGFSKPNFLTTKFIYKNNLREFIISVPKDYKPYISHDLIFAFHGRTNSNANVRGYYNLERHAYNPTIFIYPSSLKAGDGTNSWGDGESVFDYELFDFLLFVLSVEYCVDMERVFLVGHSLGASFANSLACARGDKIRAVASLGGGGSVNNCTGNFAAMVIHNPKDRLVSVKNGIKVKEAFIRNNHLNDKSKKTYPKKLKCKRYGDKNNPNKVLWCPHEIDRKKNGKYYPHNWPKNTGKYIMEFFESLR